MNAKKKISRVWLLGPILLLFVVAVLFVLVKRMEGTPPVMKLELASPFLGANQTLTLQVSDEQSGLRKVWVAILKDGQEVVLLDKTFPSAGLLAGGLVHEKTVEVPFDAQAQGIKDGKAVLRLMTRDYSWRKWGKGNQQYLEQQVVIDTQAPTIEVLSQAHNLTQGGAGLVIYKLSEDCPSSGVMVGKDFYPGQSGHFGDANIRLAFFALDYRQGPKTAIQLVATDFAGNQGRGGFPYHINGRSFKRDTIGISDKFLNWKMPEFRPQVQLPGNASNLETFLKVNNDLRKANYETLKTITAKSDAQILWKGDFLRLPHAANRAGFGDHRTYVYKGKKIDKQTHLGMDLASLAHSPVPAANSGRIAFAGALGIYGNSVVIDHGFGLFSMYSHLSHIGVSVGQEVKKGEIIAKTGSTGLAGGDHLHFSMLVRHTFVNPLEWWDAQWVQNNISSKLKLVQH